jgi:hypothetical protein
MVLRALTDRLKMAFSKLAGIGLHRPKAVGQHGFELDGLAQRAAEQFGHVHDHAIRIERQGAERLLAEEGEQAVRQRRGAGRAVHRRIDIPAHVGTAPIEPAPHEVQAADDDGEHVVEVVRDTTGELEALTLVKVCSFA